MLRPARLWQPAAGRPLPLCTGRGRRGRQFSAPLPRENSPSLRLPGVGGAPQPRPTMRRRPGEGRRPATRQGAGPAARRAVARPAARPGRAMGMLALALLCCLLRTGSAALLAPAGSRPEEEGGRSDLGRSPWDGGGRETAAAAVAAALRVGVRGWHGRALQPGAPKPAPAPFAVSISSALPARRPRKWLGLAGVLPPVSPSPPLAPGVSRGPQRAGRGRPGAARFPRAPLRVCRRSRFPGRRGDDDLPAVVPASSPSCRAGWGGGARGRCLRDRAARWR